jgi:bifunctional non-homologous end joining protein LigD
MPKKTLPTFVQPMMAKIAEEPFDSPDWIFEVKLDGYRGIAVFDAAGKPHLWSRNGLPLEKKFPAVAKALSKLKLRSTILDGEVVAVDKNGVPRFQLLQRFQKQPTAPTLSYVFDILWHNGEDLTGKTIMDRRSFLERALKPREGVQLGSYVEGEGKALFQSHEGKRDGRHHRQAQRQYLPAWRANFRLAENQSEAAAGVCRWRVYRS